MSNVEFVCSELRNNRRAKIMIDGHLLTIMSYVFDDEEKKLYIDIPISIEENHPINASLNEVFFYCMNGYGHWSELVRRYTEVFELMFREYQYTIVASYRECKVELTEKEFNGEKKDLVNKIEEWLDNIITDLTKSIKLNKVLPIVNRREEKHIGMKINDVEFLITEYDSYKFMAIISSFYGDFYAAVILKALYENENIVKESLEEFTKRCGRNEGKIFTSKGLLIQKKEGKEKLKFTYKFK